MPHRKQPACAVALNTLLYDCHGDHDDTQGGEYAWGHDGVVAYTIDPTCIDSAGKKCPANV